MTRDDFRSSGQSLAEYALLVALLCIACLGALNALGMTLYQLFAETGKRIEVVMVAGTPASDECEGPACTPPGSGGGEGGVGRDVSGGPRDDKPGEGSDSSAGPGGSSAPAPPP